MFICTDKCIDYYDNWSMSTSYGKCEICGEVKNCHDIPSKYLKRKVTIEEALEYARQFLKPPTVAVDPELETFNDDFGHNLVNVHKEKFCIGSCAIHNPSEHKMVNWPLLWRTDAGFFERMCPHGIGHPDPDDLATRKKLTKDNEYLGVHGCDGCCSKG